VQDLALEVGEVDGVHIDDAERADAGSGEVERRRRAEPARADAEHLRVEKLRLPGLAHLGEEEVAAVADLLLGGELAVLLHGQALVLPRRETAAHRGHVRVAELLQDAAREEGARAPGAVGDDGRVLVRDLLLDLHLEEAARDGDRPRDVALAELLLLADVQEDGPLRVAEARLHLVRRHLRDRLPGLVHDLLVGLRHFPHPSTPSKRFIRYSSQRATAAA
jgi:hypothetical protein